jgi:RNA polymerase sigma factor (TIGR02999 family)
MSSEVQHQVTKLLEEIREGRKDAQDALFRLVYDELRGIAHAFMRGERAGHILQPTELVHEAYPRLFVALPKLENRRHFFGVAARAMRQVLLDEARRRHASKRDPRGIRLSLSDVGPATVADDSVSVADLEGALVALEQISPGRAEAFSLYYYGGLDTAELAELIGASKRTIQADLQAARTWLHDRICADR